jgi:hypothetical protein
MKSYAVYKNKAINEISKDNVFLVKLAKNTINRINEKLANGNLMSETINENLQDKENYWYFLACYTNTVHLRNYVNNFLNKKT